MKNEQKFYSALEDIFIGSVGQKIEGKSGYVNLMKLKSLYFVQVKPFIEREVNDSFGFNDAAREEAFQKLYTFFESYLNETGTPYFSQTPFHKNLYEKVYSEREDVSLFWKTQRLYYVKSEANYHSLQNLELDGLIINFDASLIEHQKSNEKKILEFWANELTSEKVTFKVVYQDGSISKWDRLKEYLKLSKPDEIRKYLAENFGSIKDQHIIYKDNGINQKGLKISQLQRALLITNNDDLFKTVTVEFALNNLEDIEAWAKHNKIINLTVRGETLKKAQQLYKKQNEIDYFIHKDAEGFLKEQLDMFLYQYLFGDKHIGNQWTQDRIENIQKLKRIAHKIIEYIARFEDELKHIWEKKKIIKNVNYVFTLDRLFPVNLKNESDFTDKKAIDLLEKIIADIGFDSQIEEYIHLHEQWIDEKGGEIKKVWKEFEKASSFETKDIIQNTTFGRQLNLEYRYLPIDTKFFEKIKFELLAHFTPLDNNIDGTLIKSDNWQALNTILPKYREQVDLIYIDPPFNTGSDFDYKDKFQDSTWLTIIQNRLLLSYQLMSNESSFLLHLDSKSDFYGRVLLNNIFGKSNYLNQIVWYYRRWNIEGNKLASNHDIISWSVKNKLKYYFKQLFIPKSEKSSAQGKSWQSVMDDGKRRSIQTDKPTKGVPMPDAWEISKPDTWELSMINPISLERIGFITQKPEELIKRIIDMTTKPDCLIMDFFLGSGTTISTSHKMRRKWIGIEMGQHFQTIILPRLKKVLIGDTNGVSSEPDVNWKGGGFFKYYGLEQYEECLARVSYNPKWLNPDGSINDLEQVAYYTFKNSEKLLSAMLLDEEREGVKVHLQTLYPEMDEAAIAETMSNVSGKHIKTLSKEQVVFEDDTKIDFNDMNYYDPIFKDHYRSLLWWKSKE
jgi:DNA modification methylase